MYNCRLESFILTSIPFSMAWRLSSGRLPNPTSHFSIDRWRSSMLLDSESWECHQHTQRLVNVLRERIKRVKTHWKHAKTKKETMFLNQPFCFQQHLLSATKKKRYNLQYKPSCYCTHCKKKNQKRIPCLNGRRTVDFIFLKIKH